MPQYHGPVRYNPPAQKPPKKEFPVIAFLSMLFAGVLAGSLIPSCCTQKTHFDAAIILPQVQRAEASAEVNALELTIGSTVNEQKSEWAKSNAASWKALREQLEKLLSGDTTPISPPENQ